MHQISKCTDITPFTINLQELGFKENHIIDFPKVTAFADDVNIITTLNFMENKSPQIESLLELLQSYKEITGLSINISKTFAFSSIPSETLNKLQNNYSIQDTSSQITRILGHHFIPHQHLNAIPQINKIINSLNSHIKTLNRIPLQGRYLVTNTL